MYNISKNMRAFLVLSLATLLADAFTLNSYSQRIKSNSKCVTCKFVSRSRALLQLNEVSSSDNEVEAEIKPSSYSIPDVPDVESLQEMLRVSIDNASQGTFGQRGEVYFITQAFLVLCILAGGVPYIGDTLSFIAGPGLLAIGSLTIIAALVELGSADGITPWPKPIDDAELVSTGIYGLIRHPMYAGLISLMMGLSILSDSASRLLLTFVLYLVLDAKASYEESELTLLVPGYSDYKDNLVKGRFFPRGIVESFETFIEEVRDV